MGVPTCCCPVSSLSARVTSLTRPRSFPWWSRSVPSLSGFLTVELFGQSAVFVSQCWLSDSVCVWTVGCLCFTLLSDSVCVWTVGCLCFTLLSDSVCIWTVGCLCFTVLSDSVCVWTVGCLCFTLLSDSVCVWTVGCLVFHIAV